MRVVAVITVRNGIDYVKQCITHLIKNKIEVAIIDESSTDGSYEVCETFLGSGLCELQRVDYPGFFSLERQLQVKQELIDNLQTDWVIHHDIDECLDPPSTEFASLYESMLKEDKEGYSVINFNEFVFLPYEEYSSFYNSPYYYFFEPFKPRLMRAWKKDKNLSSLKSGGHLLQGEGDLSPAYHNLRHYMFTSQQHAFDKYSKRTFNEAELGKGWRKNRVGISRESLIFPEKESLEVVKNNCFDELSTNKPWQQHYWEI